MNTSEQGSTFQFFPMLSGELRNQVWELSMPDTINPGLAPYKPECWSVTRTAENHVDFDFLHDRLGPIIYHLPFAYVNHEARGIALAFAEKQGLKLYRHSERGPGYARHFDCERDALFLHGDDYTKVVDDFYERFLQPDLVDHYISTESPVRNIALPEKWFRGSLSKIPEIHEVLFNVRTLFVIVDPVPDDAHQARWEFISLRGAVCRWDRDRRRFEWSGTGGTSGEFQQWEIPKDVFGDFCNHHSSFEIRLARAIQGM